MSISSFFRKRAAVRLAIAESLERRAYLSAVTFAAPLAIPAVSSTNTAGAFSSSVTADFNGDGFIDFATIDSANHTLDVMLNNGAGTFRLGQALPTGRQPGSLQAVALSNGNVDLLFVNSVDATGEFFVGDGTGKFNVTPTTFSVGTGQPAGFTGTVAPETISAADTNGDGLPDIIVGTGNGALVSLLNSGSGQFGQPRSITGGLAATGQFVNAASSTDVVNALSNGAMQIFIDHGSGLTLTSAVQAVPGSLANASSFRSAGNVVVGDFNGDGSSDIATVITDSQTNTWFISTLLGKGDGTFQSPILTPIAGGASQLQVGNFSGGSNQDLLALYSDHTDVFIGNGDGTFVDANLKLPETGWSSAAIGDFNGDGLFDAVFGNSLLLNTTGLKTTRTAVSASANPIAPGQRVTLRAAVTGTGGTPSGSVEFVDTTTAANPKVLGAGKITNGVATLTLSLGNTIGNRRIVAEYLGDANFAAGSSAALTESVQKDAGVPTGPTILTPSIVKQTLPANAPAATKLTNASVTVKLTNSTGINAKGTVTINVYASADTTLDTSVDTLLTHVPKSITLKIGKSSTFSIPIKSLPSNLIGGAFHLIVQTVDSAGTASVASSGTFSVAAPIIALSEHINSLKLPATVVSGATLHGSSLSLTVSNSGNIPDNGFTIDLSASPTSNQTGTSFLRFRGRTKIAPGKSVRVTIPLKKAPSLAAGSYFLIAQTTDSVGGMSLPAAGSPFVVS